MGKNTYNDILNAIKDITVADLIELVKACEEEFGVSAKPEVIQDPGNNNQKQPQKTEFDVELTSYGAQKIKVIKVVREITGLGLKEAKEFVEGVPKILKEAVSMEEAEQVKAKLEEQGAVITIK